MHTPIWHNTVYSHTEKRFRLSAYNRDSCLGIFSKEDSLHSVSHILYRELSAGRKAIGNKIKQIKRGDVFMAVG